jgi:hypothetical protein
MFDDRKAAYPDGPYATFIAVLCLAEWQPERGRFRNERMLRALLGKRGRHIGYLLEHKDLVLLQDGRVYVVGWDEWQEGDWKVSERVHRIRSRRKDTPVVTAPTVTPATAPAVTPPVSDLLLSNTSRTISESVSGGGGENARAPARENGSLDDYWSLAGLAERLTGQPNVLVNRDGTWGKKAAWQLATHGYDAVGRAWTDVANDWGGYPTIRQLVLGADDRLNPLLPPKRASPDERQRQERAGLVDKIEQQAKQKGVSGG